MTKQTITQTTETYYKNGKAWKLGGTETEIVDIATVERIADSVRFFRRLGGTERLERGYTCAGYKPVKLTSTSPNKIGRTVRKFNYSYNGI
jgi:uncharacterized protein YneR